MNGVVPIDKDREFSENVSNIWNVLPDGSLEASLSGPSNLTRPLARPIELTSSRPYWVYWCDYGKRTEFDPAFNYSTRNYNVRGGFRTTEVHLDTSGASVYFAMTGTPLRQDDPNLNTKPGRYEVKAVG